MIQNRADDSFEQLHCILAPLGELPVERPTGEQIGERGEPTRLQPTCKQISDRSLFPVSILPQSPRAGNVASSRPLLALPKAILPFGTVKMWCQNG